jgi:hypothetical protein
MGWPSSTALALAPSGIEWDSNLQQRLVCAPPKQVAILHRFKFVRQFASEKSLNSERKQLLVLEKNRLVEYASASGFIKHRLR